MIQRKHILLITLTALLIAVTVQTRAVVYYSRVASGNWNTNATWSTVTYGNVTNSGTYPGASDTAMIADGNTVMINTTLTVAKISVGQGTSGILQYSNAATYTLTVTGDITINNGGKFWYNSNSTKTHTLKVSGDFTNNGVVDFYFDVNDRVNITFDGSKNDTVSGSGTWDLNTITLNKTTLSTYSLDVQSVAFETGMRTLATTNGTYIHDNSGSYSINSSSASNFTISQNVVFKINQGTVTFSPNSATLNLQGALYVNGGDVYVGTTAGTGGIRYSQVGGVVPYLEVTSGSLDVYGAITYTAVTDPLGFTMSGGTILLHNGTTGTLQDIFFISDVAGSSFTMSGGTIILQAHNLSGGPNVDFAVPGTNGTVATTGGTIQFGNASTVTGTIFNYQPFANVVMPNFMITGPSAASISLKPTASATSDLQLLSIYIDVNKTFDMRTISGTTGDTRKMTLTSSYDGITAFYNDGTFTARSSEVIFAGSSVQSLDGSSTTSFYNLTVNNSDSVILSSPEKVTNSFTMTAGKLKTTSTNILTCTSTANSNLGSASSFVDGPMNQDVAQSTARTINFPIGSGAYWRPIVFTPKHSTVSTATYMAQVVNSSAAALPYILPGTLSKVSSIRYWNIIRSGASNFSNATLKIYYGTDDGVTDFVSLRVAQGIGSNWNDNGGSGSGNGSGNITSGSFTTFSNIFTLGNVPGGLNPLPIQLLSFSGEKTSNAIRLNWTTASEINNDFFTVERANDGVNYAAITRINGAGNSTSAINYTSLDDHPINGINIYRLKQTDFDGHFSYSQPLKFTYTEKPLFLISPNPCTGDYLDVQMKVDPHSLLNISICDTNGRSVYSKELNIETPCDRFRIDDLRIGNGGIYYVTVKDHDFISTKKLVICSNRIN